MGHIKPRLCEPTRELTLKPKPPKSYLRQIPLLYCVSQRYIRCLLILALVCNGTWLSAAQGQSSELPELGDSSSRYLTAAQEKEIGLAFLRRLLKSRWYVDDLELQHYLQSLGNRIGQAADLRGTELTLNLLASNELNAFAVPGGYITFNAGLLLLMETESELASVIGHEIAHLTQRHMPRLIARSQSSTLPAAAAVLGSILLGGQAGLAGLTVTNATLISNQLRYTRDFEREADAIGIKLVEKSGFDPRAMVRFFGKLERYTRIGNDDIPEFLRTHPLTYNRIAEAESRVRELPVEEHQSSLDFYLSQAKIRARYVPQQPDAVKYFQGVKQQSEGTKKTAASYGLAIALKNERRYGEAQDEVTRLIEKNPHNAHFQILQAQLEMISEQPGKAVTRLQALTEIKPEWEFISHYLAEALLADDRPQAAKKLVRYQIRRHPERYRLYSLLSKANVRMNRLAEAHQADAEFHAAIGAYDEAIESLKHALRENPAEGYFSQSVKARIGQLEALKLRRERNT